jgi:SAM-dependent methyltransferase
MEKSNHMRRAQYEYEKILRYKILDSSPETRTKATIDAYMELFEKFPEHDVFQLDVAGRLRAGILGAGIILPLTLPGQTVLEVGCGRGDVIAHLARKGLRCVGTEPSSHMIDICLDDANVKIFCGTADHLEFPDESFDIVFSQQVIEHMHPDDVPKHFMESYRVLKEGGILSIETPNRTTGPQDVSRGFAKIAEGLHLKEWDVTELVAEFQRAGFVCPRGVFFPQFMVRRSKILFRLSTVPIVIKQIENTLLKWIPGLEFRTFIAKLIGLDDVFIFARKGKKSI